MALLIVVVCAIKYPLFRFAVDYAAATGENLVQGYARRGRWLVLVMLTVSAIEGVAAIAGVSLVTTGIAKWLIAAELAGAEVAGAEVADNVGAVFVICLTAILVAVGGYRLLESVTLTFVTVLTVLVLITTAASVPMLWPMLMDGEASAFGAFGSSAADWSFATAVAGWMPIGNTAAIILAAWVIAKSADGQRTLEDARFDFNLGYVGSSALALCFLVMGTAVLFHTATVLPAGGVQFTSMFTDMFAGAVGSWARPIVAIAALAVMYSTLLAVIDGFPRMYAEFLQELAPRAGRALDQRQLQLALLTATVTAASLFLLTLVRSFSAFIDLVTILGFLAAPIVALANQLVIEAPNVPAAARPTALLRSWNRLAIVLLLAATLGFFATRALL